MPQPERLRLHNGVQFVHEHMPALGSVAVELTFTPGARAEDDRTAGLTHFCEHMLFKGTRGRDWRDISRIGNLHGGELNAYTTVDFVQLSTRVVREDLPEALELLVEMAAQSSFPAEEFERERAVILEEISEYEDTPSDYCAERMTRALFRHGALSRPVIGFRETVSAFDARDAAAYWAATSSPHGAVLSLAGGFDARSIEAIASRTVGSLPGTDLPAPTPAQGGSAEASRLEHDERDIEQVQFCIGFQGIRRIDPRRIPLLLLDAILGGGAGSRLFNEVREKRGLAYSIGSSVATHAEGGYVMIYGSTTPDRLPEALTVCRAEILQLTDVPVGVDELATVARMQQRLFTLHADHPSSRCGRNTLRAVHAEEFHPDEDVVARILGTGPEEVRALASGLFRPWDPVLSLVGPVSEKEAAVAFELLRTT